MLSAGALYRVDPNTGQAEKIADVDSFEMAEIAPEDSEPQRTLPARTIPGAFSAEVKLPRNTVLSLLFGRRITNNWLKMHGGTMTRTTLKERRERKRWRRRGEKRKKGRGKART